MKKIFILPIVVFVVYLFFVYFASPYINFYNTEFLHPLFWFLIPITLLLFLCIFIKNIKPKDVFFTILVFGILDFIILLNIETTCSTIFCFQRTVVALITSSLFSIIYFIVLLVKNKKTN